MSTIVTRAGKGSALTHTEVDANFTNLNTDKLQSGNTAASLTITSATINGGAINSTTVGATTPSTGAFTTLSASSTSTLNGTTIPASSTLLVSGGALGTPSSGTVTNLTGTASININGTVGATTPAAGTFTSLSDSGNLTFTGTGNRITGDFSNATVANRVAFQTSTVNGGTYVHTLPNGTSQGSGVIVFNNSDPTNAAFIALTADASTAQVNTTITGTGTYLPMTFRTGGSERMRIDTSGNVGIGTSSPGSALDVKGTLRLSGSSSGYVGLAPAAAAGSTTYTLPSADGTSGQVLSTNGSGTLSWASAGGASNLSDGSATTPAVNFSADTNTGIYRAGADQLAFSTGGSQRGLFDGSGNFKFNSGYGSAATAYGCRAWVNFNGTGTVAIRASGNVSSITDNGTGDYTVNFTNAMPDANYTTFCSNRENYTSGTSDTWGFLYEGQPTTSATRVQTGQTGGKFDSVEVNVVIFR